MCSAFTANSKCPLVSISLQIHCNARDVPLTQNLKSQRSTQGLFHAGGALADATLSNQTPSHVRTATAGKLSGASLLQRITAQQPTALALLFSSVAALLGSPGQASYAAANAGLDATAGAWRGSGPPAISLQWGPWAGAGMAARHGATAARARALGLDMIQPDAGLAALAAIAVSTDLPSVVVAARFRWHDGREWGRDRDTSGTSKPLFAALVQNAIDVARSAPALSDVPTAAVLVERLQAQAAVAVSAAVRDLLGDGVEQRQPLMEAGLDSLGMPSPAPSAGRFLANLHLRSLPAQLQITMSCDPCLVPNHQHVG